MGALSRPGRYPARRPLRPRAHEDELWNDEVAAPVAGPWPLLEVDTESPVDVEAVVRFVQTSLQRK